MISNQNTKKKLTQVFSIDLFRLKMILLKIVFAIFSLKELKHYLKTKLIMLMLWRIDSTFISHLSPWRTDFAGDSVFKLIFYFKSLEMVYRIFNLPLKFIIFSQYIGFLDSSIFIPSSKTPFSVHKNPKI
jgi:hypothetical protein